VNGEPSSRTVGAAEPDRAAIFDVYNEQMARVDASASHQLTALRRALQLDDTKVFAHISLESK